MLWAPVSCVWHRDLGGLSFKLVAQGPVKPVAEHLDFALASPGRGALWLSLPGQLHLPLLRQLVACLGMLVLEVGAAGTVYTLGMMCASLLTLWCDSSQGLRGLLCSACPAPSSPPISKTHFGLEMEHSILCFELPRAL